MPRPGLQRKRTAAALSQAGRAGPDQPIRTIQPAGHTLPADRMSATDVRQHHRLMPPGQGHNNALLWYIKLTITQLTASCSNCVNVYLTQHQLLTVLVFPVNHLCTTHNQKF